MVVRSEFSMPSSNKCINSNPCISHVAFIHSHHQPVRMCSHNYLPGPFLRQGQCHRLWRSLQCSVQWFDINMMHYFGCQTNQRNQVLKLQLKPDGADQCIHEILCGHSSNKGKQQCRLLISRPRELANHDSNPPPWAAIAVSLPFRAV